MDIVNDLYSQVTPYQKQYLNHHTHLPLFIIVLFYFYNLWKVKNAKLLTISANFMQETINKVKILFISVYKITYFRKLNNANKFFIYNNIFFL